MKNKKGFTLVELLAVIVILALIMGIAVVGIGSVLSTSRTRVMYENALSIIDGVKKQFALQGEAPEGHNYGFDETMLDTGGITSPLGGNFQYRTMATGTNADTLVSKGVWRINSSTTLSGCTNTTMSYISVDSSGTYTLCLHTDGGNKYIYGTEKEISAESTDALKDAS